MSQQEFLHGRNLAPSVKDIPIVFPLPGSGVGDAKKVTDEDMGSKDFPKATNYINIKTNNIPAGHEKRIKDIENMIDFTHKWLDIHAGIQTKQQQAKGALPNDMSIESRLKRSDYRIKVLDTIINQGKCGWIHLSHDESNSYQIKIAKAKFHVKIIEDILKGITTVKAISDALEDVLKGFSDIILESKNAVQEKSLWSFLNVFTWDDVTKDVKASIRIIWYKVSANMVEYTVHKVKYEEINMMLAFQQQNCTFIEPLWISSQPELKKFLEEHANKSIRDPIEGEITP